MIHEEEGCNPKNLNQPVPNFKFAVLIGFQVIRVALLFIQMMNDVAPEVFPCNLAHYFLEGLSWKNDQIFMREMRFKIDIKR